MNAEALTYPNDQQDNIKFTIIMADYLEKILYIFLFRFADNSPQVSRQ